METKKEFSSEVQVIIPQSIALAESNLEEAITLLLGLEKKCRLHNDFTNLKEVCLHMVRLCRTKSNWDKLNSTLAVISKRRSQSKVAISAVVEEAMSYINDTPSEEVKIELIKTLKDICEGKIYVEGESARLHLMLAHMMEAKGDISAACDMIQDVHVETYGSLSKKEKAEYILEQIRLNLLKKDFIRALIQSRKMNRKVLDEEGFEEIKIRFYNLMIEYHTSNDETWETCQSYHKIFDTSLTKADPVLLRDSLESSILFLLLSKYDPHQVDMLHRLKLNSATDLEVLPAYKHAIDLFTTKEVIPTPFPFQDQLEAHASLGKIGGPEAAQKLVQVLRKRVTQHNLRVIAGYYRRIRAAQLCELLGLSGEELELHLAELASSGDAYVKIDRPAGIIGFQEPRQPAAVLSDWASDIGKMLSLMKSTCHLINRENMVHKV